MMTKIYPRTGDKQTVYLNAVVKDPRIEVGLLSENTFIFSIIKYVLPNYH